MHGAVPVACTVHTSYWIIGHSALRRAACPAPAVPLQEQGNEEGSSDSNLNRSEGREGNSTALTAAGSSLHSKTTRDPHRAMPLVAHRDVGAQNAAQAAVRAQSNAGKACYLHHRLANIHIASVHSTQVKASQQTWCFSPREILINTCLKATEGSQDRAGAAEPAASSTCVPRQEFNTQDRNCSAFITALSTVKAVKGDVSTRYEP